MMSISIHLCFECSAAFRPAIESFDSQYTKIEGNKTLQMMNLDTRNEIALTVFIACNNANTTALTLLKSAEPRSSDVGRRQL